MMRTDLTIDLVIITPKRAREWVLKAHPNNRPLSRPRVQSLVRSIVQGNWFIGDSSITFDLNGYLVNGQHRLQACIEADMPIEAGVLTNVPERSMVIMDQGRKRTLNQSLIAAGIDASNQLDLVAKNLVSSTKFSHVITSTELLDIYAVWGVAIDFVRSNVDKRVRAVVKGAIARAFYYYDDKLRLKRFADIMQATCFGDQAALIALRVDSCDTAASTMGHILADARRKGGGGTINKELYLRVETAIVKFMRGEPIARAQNLRRARGEMFPLKNCPENLKDSVIIGDQS